MLRKITYLWRDLILRPIHHCRYFAYDLLDVNQSRRRKTFCGKQRFFKFLQFWCEWIERQVLFMSKNTVFYHFVQNLTWKTWECYPRHLDEWNTVFMKCMCYFNNPVVKVNSTTIEKLTHFQGYGRLFFAKPFCMLQPTTVSIETLLRWVIS